MKLKLISDGTIGGTHVINAETGEELEHVLSATWSIGPARLPADRNAEEGKLHLIVDVPIVELSAETPIIHVLEPA